MIFEIDKPKTWKGLSYVLKSSTLKDEIISHKLDCNVHLVYWTPQRDNRTDCSLIEADYWPPNDNVDYYRFYIRSGVVPSTKRKKVETLMIDSVIPELINWMRFRIGQPDNSTNKIGMFCALYIDGKLIIKK